ncbi:hypothetical protein [Novisyntrophococcus fermenticellae]|uniref:hypothetical protein n=1 Tax=Novisyntrophococcus fermenticellae TaxID=2068655 RepID=UPI001E2C55A2|nr:hypothetical protein [Novisyntrophococcus fermenticellae]
MSFLKRFGLIMLLGGLTLTACSNRNSQNSKIKAEDDKSISESTDEKEEDGLSKTGEGVPSAKPIDLKNSIEYEVGDLIKVSSENISYDLIINSVEYTDKRSKYVPNPDKVVLITYTYKNLSDEALLIDDMRFQLMPLDESKTFELYYFDEIKVPEAIEKNKSFTAQVAYSLRQKEDELILAYHDTIHSDAPPAKIIIKQIQ